MIDWWLMDGKVFERIVERYGVLRSEMGKPVDCRIVDRNVLKVETPVADLVGHCKLLIGFGVVWRLLGLFVVEHCGLKDWMEV